MVALPARPDGYGEVARREGGICAVGLRRVGWIGSALFEEVWAGPKLSEIDPIEYLSEFVCPRATPHCYALPWILNFNQITLMTGVVDRLVVDGYTKN